MFVSLSYSVLDTFGSSRCLVAARGCLMGIFVVMAAVSTNVLVFAATVVSAALHQRVSD